MVAGTVYQRAGRDKQGVEGVAFAGRHLAVGRVVHTGVEIDQTAGACGDDDPQAALRVWQGQIVVGVLPADKVATLVIE